MGMVLGAALSLLQAAEAPRLHSGTATPPPQTLVGGGVVQVEARVVAGRVTEVRRIQGAEALLDLLEADVSTWSFERRADAAWLLVVGVYRPPELLLAAPLDPGPKRAEPSPESALPVTSPPPAYPPDAVGDTVVVVEVVVDEEGTVAVARALGDASAFRTAALDAARQWRFRPAARDGVDVATRVCLVFAFRQPVTPPAPPR